MIIKRQSIISGKTRSRSIDITEEQYARWMKGELIQNVAPHLSPDDREFIISGMTPEEWDQLNPE